MRINLKKRFTALMLAGMMVTSNVLPAYSATDGIAVEQADASYEGQAADSEASADAENSEAGGASSEQDDTGKPVADAVDSDSTTDASSNAGDESHVAGAAAGSASSTSASDAAGTGSAAAGEQTTANKSEASSGTVTEETKSDAANGTATEESKADAANGTVTEESKADAANGTTTEETKSDAANGTVTEEGKSDAANGTGAEESKADTVHGSNAGGSTVVGAGSVGIGESTGAAVEIEETKPTELLEEETKLATESEISKEEDEKKLEEKENRKIIYTDIRAGIKVTATLEDADAVPDDARLHVSEIKDKKMYAAYLEAMDEAEPEIKHTKKNTVLRDISFIMKDEDGKEIEYEPKEGSVKITIEYLENHLQDWFGVEDAAEVKTYHLPLAEGVKAEGEKTIDVKNVKASDINVQELDSDVKTEKTVEVEVDSFSMFAMRRAKAKSTSIDLNTAVQTVSVTTIGGQPFDPSKQYPRDAEIEFKLEYKFPESNKPKADGIRTATYSLPIEVNASNATGNISCEGYTAGYAGTYEIKDGKVIFIYSTEFLNAHPSGIEGTFSFKSWLSRESTSNKEQIEINFGGAGTTTPITIKLEEGKVSANKSCALHEDGTIDFTISLTVTDKDVKNLVLTDTQGSNLAFADSPEFKLDGNSITPSKKDDQTVEFRIDTLAIGTHTLTYKAKIKDVNVSGDPNKNIVHWSWTGGKGDENGAGTTVVVNEKKLRKTGTGDKNTNEITWTVIYVPGTRGMVAGKTFTDTLGPDQKYGDTYEVYYDPTGTEYYVGGTLIDSGKIDSSKTPFTYTFPVTQTANKGSYKIVYKTIVTKDLSASSSKETFTNTIRDDDGLESTGTAEIDKSKPQLVSKWGVSDSKTRIATWTVKVAKHPDNKPIKNLRVIDELKDNATWKGKYLSDDITVKVGSDTLTRDTDYSVTFGTSTDGNPTMTIAFKREVNDEVNITYKTDYNTDPAKSGNVTNIAHATYKTDDYSTSEDAEKTVYFQEINTKFKLNKTGEIFGGVANWKVEINTRTDWMRAALSERVVKNISDIIPEGMEYVDGSLKCSIDQDHWGSTDPIPYDNVEVTYHKDTRTLIININGLDFSTNDDYQYKYIVLEYQTRVTKKPVSGEKIIFTNTVNVGGETKSESVDMTCTELDKQGKQVADVPNVVEYKIGVNYSAADLLSGKDTLELKDTLDADLTLDTSSIKVTDMYTGESVDYKASFGTTSDGKNTMTLTIPDQRALLVTYRASLVTAGKTKDTVYHVSNKATLTGSDEKTVEVNTDVKYETSEATVQGKSDSIIIKKVDDKGKALEKAKFVVAEVEPSSLNINGTEKIVNTDESGVAKFENLSYNTLYYYQETQAPDGYKITDGARHYFIIKNAEREEDYTELIKKIKTGTKYAPLTGGNTFIVENEKIVGSLKLTKAVSGVADSSKYTDKTYEFIVKNSAGQYVKSDGSLSSTEVTVSVKSGASVTISGLEPGTYTVSEKTDAGLVNIGGYDFKGVTGTGNVEVVSGTVEKTITNTYEKPTVPETTPVETTPEETTVPETTPTETTVPETTPAETTTPSGGGGGGGGEHPHPLPETTPVETTPAETTVPETTPVETTTSDGGNGGNHGPSEEVETDEYGRVRGANRGKTKNGQDGGNVKGANRGKTRTGDESMMSIFGFGFLAAVLVLLGWFGIRFTKRNRR